MVGAVGGHVSVVGALVQLRLVGAAGAAVIGWLVGWCCLCSCSRLVGAVDAAVADWLVLLVQL